MKYQIDIRIINIEAFAGQIRSSDFDAARDRSAWWNYEQDYSVDFILSH